jgi:energy-coupling factor transporter ATP-binding protein EcfA2
VNLRISHLGPLEDITCTFDEQVNVFVGPNNCGKSTTLTALGNILACLAEVPRKLYRQTPAAFAVQYVGTHAQTSEFSGVLPMALESTASLHAWEGMLSTLGYSVFVPALRQSTGFRAPWSVGASASDRSIPQPRQTSELAQSLWGAPELPEELRRRLALLATDPGLIRDEVAIASMVELNSRAYRWNDPALHGIIAQVATIASEITEGFPMQFLRVAEDQDGLVPQFSTPDGDIPFTVLSQGTQSVMQWLTYVLAGYAKYYGYPTNLAAQPGVVIVDEIDAHLHPAAQRRVIPALQRHFPRLQIFCSTHSPLMLAGLKTSQMQLFRRDERGKVTVSRNETALVGWSIDEILRGFLGVEQPADVETERHIRRLQELQRPEGLAPTETAQHPVEAPLVPAAPPPVPVPKAKTSRPARTKRSTDKTGAAARVRRPSRSK